MPIAVGATRPPASSWEIARNPMPRRERDQHDLAHRRERFGLAVAEAVLSSAGCAATHTPTSVTTLATRSSAVSARLPSIAVEPVASTAHLFSTRRSSAIAIEAKAALRVSGRAWAMRAHG